MPAACRWLWGALLRLPASELCWSTPILSAGAVPSHELAQAAAWYVQPHLFIAAPHVQHPRHVCQVLPLHACTGACKSMGLGSLGAPHGLAFEQVLGNSMVRRYSR